MQSTSLTCHPIGYFYCSESERYCLPKQPGLNKDNQGVIILNSHQNFEQALEDLNGFNRIWVLFWFHRNVNWKPKVLTPRGFPKRGLFATRSPHRPNPLGLSCVELIQIEGLKIHIANHDLLDGSPILDIKPYVVYADAWEDAEQGWLDSSPEQNLYEIHWSPLALEQIDYLELQWKIKLKEDIQFRLKTHPFPSANNRILNKGDSSQLSYKTWRIQFKVSKTSIEVFCLYSGYDSETLNGLKESKWDDIHIHRDFCTKFSNFQLE
ncbi:MAG: tRNA (N6-threonylcarbamoyladenosine(37)-N6)-methyltransferase TrmO [Parachlamydiaceae bacterium]|nr:MAG: tRNA (N6-threonylcarbamoyladenosine(37)-N6)-methyltransferase TrmO [Parachlamydiaceae bacterium]